jgi:adenylate cyclase
MLAEADKLVELNPSNAFWAGSAGWAIALGGEWDRGVALIRQGFELNPFHPGWHHYPIHMNHYRNGEYEESLAEARNFNLPEYFWSPMLFAATYGQLGLEPEGSDTIEQLLSLNPDFANQPRFYISNYVFDDEVVGHLLEGLAKAGLEIPPDAE